VSNQPAQEWDDMSKQQQTEIRARLLAACETRADASTLGRRARLERASRSGLAARLARH
jgi:hypothetical protein